MYKPMKEPLKWVLKKIPPKRCSLKSLNRENFDKKEKQPGTNLLINIITTDIINIQDIKRDLYLCFKKYNRLKIPIPVFLKFTRKTSKSLIKKDKIEKKKNDITNKISITVYL